MSLDQVDMRDVVAQISECSTFPFASLPVMAGVLLGPFIQYDFLRCFRSWMDIVTSFNFGVLLLCLRR